MLLHNIFVKPIDRQIEGVIKADDESMLRNEIEEYVVTGVISKELDKFFDDYLHSNVVNGVWLSGFFGSGKSHLLKMLAYLLENKEVEGTSVLDLFLDKCENDAILAANMKKVCEIPTKSILFNIAQKANVLNQNKNDALVSVFVKVFNEMCGYFGNQPYIAQFERDLDKRGQYEDFKEAFENIAGITWEQGREQPAFEKTNIAKAYSQITEEEGAGDGILDIYRSEYQLSIKDFAEDVKKYIESREKGFRLVFFVDEVGQFIANDVQLMLSLQTIVESLASICNRQAWVVVTAQDDLNKILGDMKANDTEISRIQDRFLRRIKLTGANVDEVIQKRLLAKTSEGKSSIGDIYVKEVNNLKTLFNFTDGAKVYRNFKDRDNFVECYPFIPYQFTLFQSSLQNLSKHEAFTGKFSSVGERSMLAVFQIVAKQIKEERLGKLATFDMMFEGIRSTVKSNVQWGITQAEDQLDDSFTIQILKALFLVKYVPEFQATVRNISVLMITSFDQDIIKLRKQVEQALNTLEQQTYIKRNENLYEYLTDEERDVETSIKSTDIDISEIDKKISSLIFDSILKNNKIRYKETGTDYPFTRKVDRLSYGREYELGIDFIINNDDLIDPRALSIQEDDLIVQLPSDDRFYKEVQLHLQTEKYFQQTYSSTHKVELKRILSSVAHQNQERLEALKRTASELIVNSKMYVAGDDVDGISNEPQAKINNGFQKLIERQYPNLVMLRDNSYTENDISKYLNSKDTLQDLVKLSESQAVVLRYIESNIINNTLRVKVKNLVETFEKKPYGWPVPAILCHIAMLKAYAKIDVRQDSNILEGVALERALRNTATHANLYLELQKVYDKKEIKNLKNFYENLFDTPASANEPKPLVAEFQESLRNYINELDRYKYNESKFPFLSVLNRVSTELKKLDNKDDSYYFKDLESFTDNILKLKEEVVDPIKSFMNGPRKNIYYDAREFLVQQEDNLVYLKTDNIEKLNSIIKDEKCFVGNKMQTVKATHSHLKEQVEVKLNQEIEKAQEYINEKETQFYGMNEFELLKKEQKSIFENKFKNQKQSIINSSKIAMIRDKLNTFDNNTYLSWMNELDSLVKPKKDDIQTKTFVSISDIYVDSDKKRLSSSEDIDEYISNLKIKLLEKIENGNEILL